MSDSIRMTPISGNSFRPSLFGSTVQQTKGFHPTLSGGYWMGQTPAEWYRRAKDSLAKFDQLVARMNLIANQTERKNIQQWIGSASDPNSPAYRYQSVKSDLQTDVESFTPPAINAYQVERRTNRIGDLEDINNTFEAKVSNAETVYGKLPAPTVITQAGGVIGKTPSWVLPVVVGAGALAVAGVVTLLAGKKK